MESGRGPRGPPVTVATAGCGCIVAVARLATLPPPSVAPFKLLQGTHSVLFFHEPCLCGL